jgi:hypothetical protein
MNLDAGFLFGFITGCGVMLMSVGIGAWIARRRR